MLDIIIGAFILVGAMYVVGRHEAELSLPIALMIAAGVSITTAVLSVFLGILALPIGFVIATAAIYKFCYLGWGKAALVSVIYFGSMILIGIAFAMMRAS